MHKQTIIDFKALGKRLIFTQPIAELVARKLDDVKQVLRQVQTYQDHGFYVVGYVSYEAALAFEAHFALSLGSQLHKEESLA